MFTRMTEACAMDIVANSAGPEQIAKVVEEGTFSWETPVTAIYPTFKLESVEGSNDQ